MRKFIIMAVAIVALAFAGQAMASDGASIFSTKCAMCHGQGGVGSTMAPTLKGNAFIKGDASENTPTSPSQCPVLLHSSQAVISIAL